MGTSKDLNSPLLPYPEKPNDLKINLLGCFSTLLGSIFFVGNLTVIQWREINAIDLSFVRGTLNTIFVGCLCLIKGHSLLPKANEKTSKTRLFVILQGILGGMANIMTYGCIRMMTIGDASTLMMAAPPFTFIFSFLCLKARISLSQICLILVNISGAILVIQPPFIFGTEATYSMTQSTF